MWPAVLVARVGCYLLKLAGYLVPEQLLDNPRVARITALIPVAMLTALVVVQTLARHEAQLLHARQHAGQAGAGGR